MSANTPKVKHPIFDQYDLREIAAQTGYSEWTLLDVRDRGRPATRKFRLACVHAFGRTEEELFGPTEEVANANP